MRPLRVVLADGGLVPRAELLRALERAGFDVVGEAVGWTDVPSLVSARAADLVIVGGSPDFAAGSRSIDGTPSLALVPDARASKDYVDTGVFGVLTFDAEPELVASAAALAVARATDQLTIREEAVRLADALEARKSIERAKGVLMKRLDLSESDAYRKIQRASQEENRKMRDIAESILSAERLYGDDAPPNPD